MDFLDKAGRTRTWSPPAPDRLTCRLVRAMATARVARKESEGPSRVQGLETESQLAVKETAAAMAAAPPVWRPEHSARSKLRGLYPNRSRWIADQPRHQERLLSSPIRSTLRKLANSNYRAQFRC